MKILRIVSSGFEEGGAENGIVRIQSILEKSGHTIKILASDSRPDLPHFNHYSFRAPHGPFAKLMYTFNISAYCTLKKTLHKFKPDIVHLHTLGFASPLILFALRGQKVVATIHGPEGYTKSLLMWCLKKSDFKHGEYSLRDLRLIGKLRYFYYRYVNYPLYKLGLRNVDCFVTISTFLYALMEGEGIKSTYIPNGIGMLAFRPLPHRPSRTLVFAGRLEKFKGVEYVLRALPEIIAEFPDTHFFVAGEGRERKELQSLAHTLGVARHVEFLGHIGRPALEALYERASVAVVPSIWPEICSKSGIEAMSAGRPVVASRVGGMSDWLIHEKTGYLVPPHDSAAIAEAVKKLFADPHLLIQMGKNARVKAEDFAIELHAQRMEKIYERVLGRRNADTNESDSR